MLLLILIAVFFPFALASASNSRQQDENSCDEGNEQQEIESILNPLKLATSPVAKVNQAAAFNQRNYTQFNDWLQEDAVGITKNEVQLALNQGRSVERAPKGASGTYFLRNSANQVIAVFKPQDEESFGPNNPNLGKRIHRKLAPCTYKIKELIKNGGYLCEVAASRLDKVYELHLVPVTFLVSLSSPAFHYTSKERKEAKRNTTPLPAKTGSLQLFVRGFSDASDLITSLTLKGFTEQEYPKNFLDEFQRLCILDLLIRNTDRHFDNWLMKTTSGCETCQLSLSPKRYIKIAAIDHGLSFPHKIIEPRRFTYNWVMLPVSFIPFKESVINKYLPILEDCEKERELERELRAVFKHHKEFDEEIFQDQMAIIRGQKKLVLEALRLRQSPNQLANKKPLYLFKKDSVCK
jgi:phosphatidylinositol 4-kinase type 2